MTRRTTDPDVSDVSVKHQTKVSKNSGDPDPEVANADVCDGLAAPRSFGGAEAEQSGIGFGAE